jgi:hypothetical protein
MIQRIVVLSLFVSVTFFLNAQTTYTFTGSGNWNVAANWDANGIPPNPLPSGDEIIIQGTPSNQNGGGRTINGTLTVNSGVTLTSSNVLTIGTTGTLTNNGNIVRSNGLNIDGTGTNDGTITQDAGTFSIGATGSFVNNGTITNNATLTNANSFINEGDVENFGTLNAATGDGDVFDNNGTVTNAASGTITIARTFNNNAGSMLTNSNQITINNNAASILTNSGEIENSGTITNNNDLNNSGLLTNDGTIANGNGPADRLNNTGTLINDGTIANNNVANLDNTGGTVSGTGSITGGFTNAGTLSPGTTGTIGSFTISGGFTNTATGTILADIQGSPVAGDQVVVGGTSTLGGTLTVSQIGTGSISSGDAFTIISGTFSGNFLTVNLPSPPVDWTIDSASPDYVLTYNNATPLPIELLTFQGKQVANTIELLWQTASEQNNAYIDLERSPDGIRFAPIHRAKGYGTTSEPKTYQYTDGSPLPGINYYRLRQVDTDDKATYHDIIAVEFDGKTTQTDNKGIRLFPTEVQHQLTVVLDAPLSQATELYIVDMLGRVVQRQRLGAGTAQEEVSVAGLPQGQYFISMPVGQQLKTVRFVKL